jgi:hypothetical protein
VLIIRSSARQTAGRLLFESQLLLTLTCLIHYVFILRRDPVTLTISRHCNQAVGTGLTASRTTHSLAQRQPQAAAKHWIQTLGSEGTAPVVYYSQGTQCHARVSVHRLRQNCRKVDELSYNCQHFDIANTRMSPLLNNRSCRPSRLPSSFMLHVIKWCMSSVGRCSNTNSHPSTGFGNGFTAKSSFKRRIASTYSYQNTIRKKDSLRL